MPARSISPARRVFALPLTLCATLALGACAAQTQQEGVSGERSASATPAGQVVGEPVSCIQTSRIRNTKVHNDETIDFEMLGGMVYRNTLPNRCPSLGFEERFAYRTSIGQLCSTDIITVLYSDGTRGAGCGLGQFLPIELNAAGSQAASQPAP
jgi:hypothetical protein